MKNPTFSVIIPAHNEENVIERAVNSVLRQTYKNFEIIVVNDGSADKTHEIVERLIKRNKNIRLINFDKGHSAAFARNRGAEKASGKILLFLDADCYINDQFLEEIKKHASKADAFITLNYPLKDNFMSWALSKFVGPPKKAKLLDGTVYTKANKDEAGSMFFCITKKAYDKIKGYDESIFYYEDIDFNEKFWSSGFKGVFVKGANQYFELPITLSEFNRQCRWIGRGINNVKDNNERRKQKTIWMAKSLFLLSPFVFYWNLQYFSSVLLFTLVVSYLAILLRSKDVFGSFAAVPFLYIKTWLVTFNMIRFWAMKR